MEGLGARAPRSFADDGTLFYHRDVGDIDVYVQPFDLHGSPTAPERVSPTMVGRHSMPAWSPDGRSLAFITNWLQGHRSLTIRDMRSLSERHIVLPFKISPYVAMPQWSPDGERVVYRGNDAQGRPGYFGTEVATGAVSPILLFDNPRDEGQYSAFQWSPDGQSFFYLHRQRGLVERRIATGAETHRSVPGFEFRPSPDGSSIAVLGTAEKIFTLYVVPLHGAARELMKFSGPQVPALQGWSAVTSPSRPSQTTWRARSGRCAVRRPLPRVVPRRQDPDTRRRNRVPRVGVGRRLLLAIPQRPAQGISDELRSPAAARGSDQVETSGGLVVDFDQD